MILCRERRKAGLGRLDDFPTSLQEGLDDFELDVENIKVKERSQGFKFRSSGKKRSRAGSHSGKWRVK